MNSKHKNRPTIRPKHWLLLLVVAIISLAALALAQVIEVINCQLYIGGEYQGDVCYKVFPQGNTPEGSLLPGEQTFDIVPNPGDTDIYSYRVRSVDTDPNGPILFIPDQRQDGYNGHPTGEFKTFRQQWALGASRSGTNLQTLVDICVIGQPSSDPDADGDGIPGCNDVCEGMTSATDPRTGMSYPIVELGNQCWFQKNLSIGNPVVATLNVGSLYSEFESEGALWPYGNADDACGWLAGGSYDPTAYCHSSGNCYDSGGPIGDTTCAQAVALEGTDPDYPPHAWDQYCQDKTGNPNSYCKGAAGDHYCSGSVSYTCNGGGVTYTNGDPIEIMGCVSDDPSCNTTGGFYTLQQALRLGTADKFDDICPDGWRIPTDSDWKELEQYYGMSAVEADTFGSRSSGDVGTDLKNENEFKALVDLLGSSGEVVHYMTSTYRYKGYDAFEWQPIMRTVYEDNGSVERWSTGSGVPVYAFELGKRFAFSLFSTAQALPSVAGVYNIRCIKGDKAIPAWNAGTCEQNGVEQPDEFCL